MNSRRDLPPRMKRHRRATLGAAPHTGALIRRVSPAPHPPCVHHPYYSVVGWVGTGQRRAARRVVVYRRQVWTAPRPRLHPRPQTPWQWACAVKRTGYHQRSIQNPLRAWIPLGSELGMGLDPTRIPPPQTTPGAELVHLTHLRHRGRYLH